MLRIGHGRGDLRTLSVMWGIGLAVLACTPAWGEYDLSWYTVDGGGDVATMSDSYTLSGTIGQPDAGAMTGGTFSLNGGFWVGGIGVVGIGDDNETPDLPRSFGLHLAAPNPLVRRSVIAFDLPHARLVRLLVYDATGRLARTLADGPFPAGRHQRVWDANDDGGHPVATGIYFVRFEAETYRAREKIVVLR
jgi:hypothetical protein